MPSKVVLYLVLWYLYRFFKGLSYSRFASGLVLAYGLGSVGLRADDGFRRQDFGFRAHGLECKVGMRDNLRITMPQQQHLPHLAVTFSPTEYLSKRIILRIGAADVAGFWVSDQGMKLERLPTPRLRRALLRT